MKINTGNGTVNLITLVAVLSLSLVVNIPGLAITPLLGNLTTKFQSTDLEIQLLSMLPNICIIPFMLLSNFIIVKSSKTIASIISLLVFLLSGIGFFFVHNITLMIILSCILGCACGLITPIAASMVADMFTGQYRVKQLGIKSGIANLSLVCATFIVGILAQQGDWRLPFVVYLIPIIPLLFSPWLFKAERLSGWKKNSKDLSVHKNNTNNKIKIQNLVSLMFLYFFITYCMMALPYYLAYDEPILHITDEWNGAITSIFYLMIFLGGSALFIIIRVLRNWTIFIAALFMSIGLLVITSGIPGWAMCICSAVMGIGYGIIQPVIYNKTAEVANSKRKTTLALSWVMCMNYLSIAIAPLITDGIRELIHTNSNIFPFYLNGILCLLFCILVLIRRNGFTFSISQNYYK